ncbi:hypothetical protein CEXT_404801 [Caerostris extrusa]|uniref:Uncharacterized protein n=1 Tax=Caerostris extrusa TaxID=172846 RepID=A0AAV4UVS5_CAEEX|nr:hypothetical protein CEXT_404801 [Caerostris extrusa]
MKLKLTNSVCALCFLFTIILNVLIQETAAESLESSITPLDTLKDNFEASALLKKELIFQQSPCDCGVNSTKCEIVDGVKKCECRNNFYDNGGNCVACDCGVGSYGCSMKDGKKDVIAFHLISNVPEDVNGVTVE